MKTAQQSNQQLDLVDKTFLNSATFVGIDAHCSSHTVLAINRFEDEKGYLTFDNNHQGILKFLNWLSNLDHLKVTKQTTLTQSPSTDNIIIGVEGGGNYRHALINQLLNKYRNIFEVNPLYTKQRRSFGTKGDKSDKIDAKIIAEVLTRKLDQLPRIIPDQLTSSMLCLRKLTWFYEETVGQGTRLKNQLHGLKKEYDLAISKSEKKVLDIIIKDKQGDLKKVNRTKTRLEHQLAQLIPEKGKNLTTIPGISTITAAQIITHSQGLERFKNIDGFIKYAGIAPKDKSSGKFKKQVLNSTGNRYLNSAFYMAALNQTKYNPKAKEYYHKKISEGKTKTQALVCVMKRTACIVYGMLKSGTNYTS